MLSIKNKKQFSEKYFVYLKLNKLITKNLSIHFFMPFYYNT
jgi:hypothetical protein